MLFDFFYLTSTFISYTYKFFSFFGDWLQKVFFPFVFLIPLNQQPPLWLDIISSNDDEVHVDEDEGSLSKMLQVIVDTQVSLKPTLGSLLVSMLVPR